MKSLLLTFILASSADTFAWDLPVTAKIKWLCEEGVGNFENPAPLISIEGEFKTAVSREFSLREKQRLQVSIFEDNQETALETSDYQAFWENDLDFQSLKITTGEKVYIIQTTPGRALILTFTEPGRYWGTMSIRGSCN